MKYIIALLVLTGCYVYAGRRSNCQVSIWPVHQEPGTSCEFMNEVMVGSPQPGWVSCGEIRVMCNP